MLTRKLVVLIAALLFAWPLQAAQQTIFVGSPADKKSLDTNFGNAQANFVELYGWVDQGVKTTSSPSFVSVTATGGTLRGGVAGTTQGALVLHTNTDPIYTFGLMPAAAPSEIVSLKAPPAMPGGSNYLWNVDADGTGGWTDPATFQVDLAVPSQAEAEAGTATDERVWTAERVKQAIVALGTGLTSLPTADNQIFQATGAGTYAWTNTLEGIGSIEATGTLQGKMVFNSYATDTTLTADNNNSAVVQFTVAGEATMWDCEATNVGDFVMLWARDAEKIEVVPASGDHFNLFAGTALTADYELDVAATAGTKVTLMCTADDTWSVYSETAACADGGVAD